MHPVTVHVYEPERGCGCVIPSILILSVIEAELIEVDVAGVEAE